MESSWSYCSVGELKAQLEKVGTTKDSIFGALIYEASREVDRVCNRPDGFRAAQQATSRTYAGMGSGVLWIDDCVEITAVGAKNSPSDPTYTAWQTADWLAGRGDPFSPDLNHTPYQFLLVAPAGAFAIWPSGRWSGLRGFTPDPDTRRRSFEAPTVQVTARYGFADDTPGVIKQATITYAARWWKRGQAAWADAVADSNTGLLLYKQPMDPDIVGMLKLGRYIRPSV